LRFFQTIFCTFGRQLFTYRPGPTLHSLTKQSVLSVGTIFELEPWRSKSNFDVRGRTVNDYSCFYQTWI